MREPFVEPHLLLEPLAAEPERTARLRGELLLQVLDVRADGVRGLDLRVSEIAEQVHVVHARERPRQVVVDELQRPAHRFDADLDEDARADP